MSDHNPRTDRYTLTNKAYSSDEKLRIRIQTHELYSEPKIDFQSWVLDRIVWRGDEVVLDVGMGAGAYFEPVLSRIPNGMLVAGDLSFGMAQKAVQSGINTPIHIFNGDVQSLPFAENTFDVVLANHMLYHVPDLSQALDEIQRVLKSDGQLIAATNSAANMPEFDQLKWRALSRLGVMEPNHDRFDTVVHGFGLKDAAILLHRHFFAVVRHDLPGALVFPEVQPVLDYINSTRDLEEPGFPHRINWDDYMTVMAEQVQRLIGHFGELTVTKLSGALVATQRGGFIRSFWDRLHAVPSSNHESEPQASEP